MTHLISIIDNGMAICHSQYKFKENNDMNIAEMMAKIKEDIKQRCNSANNPYGPDIYYHIECVVTNAVNLAALHQADVEICEIAAWFHDIAAVTDPNFCEEHHIYGADMAQEILEAYGYPQEKIDKVKVCILNHRGSVLKEKLKKEEICVADADAAAHFDMIPSLFYLAYMIHGLNQQDGIRFVREKLERTCYKMSLESKMYYKDKIEAAQIILDYAFKNE